MGSFLHSPDDSSRLGQISSFASYFQTSSDYEIYVILTVHILVTNTSTNKQLRRPTRHPSHG